jgi:hypothetical protein
MTRYAWVYRAIQGTVILMTMAILAMVFLPLWEYERKQDLPVSVHVAKSDESAGNDAYEWIISNLKLEESTGQDADILVVKDAAALTENIYDMVRNKTVIFEQLFSQIGDSRESTARLNYLTGATYSGYVGRTYQDLEDMDEVPQKLVELYEQSQGKVWSFYGEGIILDNGYEVIVLKRGKDYTGSLKLVSGKMNIPYSGTFEITSGHETVEAQFSLDLSPSGKSLFDERSLPGEFPAMYSIEENMYNGCYFAGDFSNRKIEEPSNYESITSLMKARLLYDRATSEESFWTWYIPKVKRMVEGITSKKMLGESVISLKQPERDVSFSADSKRIYKSGRSGNVPFFVRGVNLMEQTR